MPFDSQSAALQSRNSSLHAETNGLSCALYPARIGTFLKLVPRDLTFECTTRRREEAGPRIITSIHLLPSSFSLVLCEGLAMRPPSRAP